MLLGKLLLRLEQLREHLEVSSVVVRSRFAAAAH